MRRKNIFLYYTKKLITFVLSVLVLSVVVFYVARLAPGDPLYSYYGDRVEKMSDSEREWAQEQLGLNKPIHIQYIHWFENAIRGNFGISYKYKTDVLRVIGGRLPNTLILGGSGFVLIFGLALGLGILCTWYEDKWPDRLLCKIGIVTSCVPEFWLSIALIFIFSVNLKLLPSSGAYSIGNGYNAIDRISHLALPLIIVVISHLWYYAYMIRNKLLEEVRAEYVLLAKSKGLSKKSILFKHCLRNIVPSYLSIMAISVPHILGGTYIVETVFSYPGIGTLSYESARYQDYNLLMALCILSGTLVILCNIAVQIVNEKIDPRMKKDERVQVVKDESVQVSEVMKVG